MELAALIVSIISLVTAMVSAAFAIHSSAKASALAKENTGLNHAMVELEVRTAITEATARVNEVVMLMNPLLSKEKLGQLNASDADQLERFRNNAKAEIQGMLNTYDEACAKYLDRKIDRERFRKNYHIEIRNLLERESLKEYFDPHTSRYKGIIKVYHEWEDLEK